MLPESGAIITLPCVILQMSQCGCLRPLQGSAQGIAHLKTIDITTTMYWHDTGKVVNLPFFQCLSDIDAGANYFKEAWEAKSGFSGIFYKYSHVFPPTFSGNRAATPKATDVGGDDSLVEGRVLCADDRRDVPRRVHRGKLCDPVHALQRLYHDEQSGQVLGQQGSERRGR